MRIKALGAMIGLAPLAAAALVNLGLSSSSVAAESELVIEEVIVTARKREESAQEVPVAITALTGELRDATVRNLADLNGYAPNVSIRENSGRARGTNISIRGVAAAEVTDKSHDSPIAVSIDGVFMGTTSGRNVENFDIERIEVLRGPQGTLFGKNTVGGVINVVRTKPTGEFGGKARVTFGRYGQQEIRSLINFPITESLAAKLFYTSVNADGHMKNTFLDERGPEKDYANFGLTLFFTPTENFDALLTVERYNDKSDLGAFSSYNFGAGFFDPPPAGSVGLQDLSPGFSVCNAFNDCRTTLDIPDTYSTSTTNQGRYRNDAYSLNMNLAINDNLRVVSVTGYHDTPYEDSIAELDGSHLPFIWIDNDNVYDQFTQELRLEGSFADDRLDFVAGVYYLDSHYEQDWITYGSFWDFVTTAPVGGGSVEDQRAALAAVESGNGVFASNGGVIAACLAGLLGTLRCDTGIPAGSALGPNFVQKLFQEQDTSSLALFFQADYAVTDRLSVTAGIRYTDEEKEFIGWQSYLAPLARARVFNFVDAAELGNEWKETSIKLGFDYQLREDMMFYASYSEGFKSGGFFGRNQNLSDFERNQYDPEYAESWEAGLKSQFLNNRLQLNLAAFFNDFTDKQDSNVVLDPSSNTVATVWENIGGIEYWGAEADLRFVATENLDVFATLGWLDAEYNGFESTRFVPLDDMGRVTAPPQNVDFLTPKLAPEWTIGLGGTYVVRVGPGDLSIGARWNFVDEVETDTYNGPGTAIGSQNFINARVAYEWNNMRVSAYGDNLTDEINEIAATAVFPWFGYSIVDRGRTYGVELEVQF